MNKAFAALDEDTQKLLVADLQVLIDGLNRAGDDTMVVPGEYLEVIILKE
jgi:hypothetical protein